MTTLADNVRNVLLLEAFADEARRLAAAGRAALNDKARKQLTDEGVAPSWNLPNIAKVTLGVTKQSLAVSQEAKFTEWVAVRYPDAIQQVTVTQVRPADLAKLLASFVVDGTVAADPETGEIVPGVAVRKGGEPANLTIKADPGIKESLAVTVGQMLVTAHPAITGPAEPDLPAPSNPWIPAGDPFAVFPAGDTE